MCAKTDRNSGKRKNMNRKAKGNTGRGSDRSTERNMRRNTERNTDRKAGRRSSGKKNPAGGADHSYRKNRRGRQQLLLLAASLIAAAILLLLARTGIGGGQQASGGAGSGAAGNSEGMIPAGARSTGPAADSMIREAYEKEDPELAAWMEPAGNSREIERLVFSRTGEGAEAAAAGPLEKIAFTAGNNNRFQRSFPVQIDAENLGGAQGTFCWAVFLPADMTEHPCILFSDYTEVSLVPLQEGERLNGARLVSGKKGAAGQTADQGTRAYTSGDEVSGLWDGSAFRVVMTGADGSVQEDIMYVFSCTGTPSMYLDTESGSMAAVDGDRLKQTSEAVEYLVCMPDGTADCAGYGSVSGRGNSTWKMPKRPYNLSLSEKQSVLGMTNCKKLCLLSNSFDRTNLLNRISSQIAMDLQVRDTPQGEFVNLFLNGKYNGLYYLSQRPRDGGSVHIQKLDNQILKVNGRTTAVQKEDSRDDDGENDGGGEGSGETEDLSSSETSASGISASGSSASGTSSSGVKKSELPKRIALHKEGERLKKWAYSWPREPADNTGGYLLQQYEKYEGTDGWFSTLHRRFRIKSPAWPTVGEVNYLQDYMLAAERAIYSEDGTDPETGKGYGEYLDLPSWEDMFLLEEFFAEWDAERWSFYLIKDRGDPLIYCGPMWDFDHSAGTMLYGNYPETAVSLLMLRDTRHGWMNRLLAHKDFEEGLHKRWREFFSPYIRSYLDTQFKEEVSAIESAAYMNNIRRGNDNDFRSDADRLHTWLQRRSAFLDEYSQDPGAFSRVQFSFQWGDLTHYVHTKEALGYLPLPEYGETQVKTQILKNEIIGWQDENGEPVSADVVIDRDRVFTPIYKKTDQINENSG